MVISGLSRKELSAMYSIVFYRMGPMSLTICIQLSVFEMTLIQNICPLSHYDDNFGVPFIIVIYNFCVYEHCVPTICVIVWVYRTLYIAIVMLIYMLCMAWCTSRYLACSAVHEHVTVHYSEYSMSYKLGALLRSAKLWLLLLRHSSRSKPPLISFKILLHFSHTCH